MNHFKANNFQLQVIWCIILQKKKTYPFYRWCLTVWNGDLPLQQYCGLTMHAMQVGCLGIDTKLTSCNSDVKILILSKGKGS